MELEFAGTAEELQSAILSATKGIPALSRLDVDKISGREIGFKL